MKTTIKLAILSSCLLSASGELAHAQGTAFSYQGKLNDGANPANGIYDVRFTVWDAPTNGYLVAWPLTNSAIPISNGLFTVTLDFGSGVFTGADRWLELDVRTNGNGAFTPLLPFQPIQPMPYAIMANSASNLLGSLPAAQLVGSLPVAQLSGTVPMAQLPPTIVTNGATGVNFTGIFSGNGTGMTNVPGTLIWQIVGGTNQLAQPNANYLLTNPAPSTITLPGAASVGDVVRVSGAGAGGWQVIPNLGQTIAGYSAVLSLGDTWATHGDPSQAWYGLAADYDGSTLIAAGSYSGQIAVSHDYGTNWITRGAVSYWPAAVTSADGNKLAVFQQSGQIYTSSDGGSNWVARGSSRNWSALASSADGTRLAAPVYNGQIYISMDSGATWVPHGASLAWVGIAMSADGSKLAATVTGGQIYTSTDGGTNWTARESNRSWSGIASSADGCKLLAGTGGGYLYTSTDSGVTWMPRGSTGNWAYVASSADGNRLMANDHGCPSSLYVSTDAGVTWSLRETPRCYWRQVAVSGDGELLAAEVDRGYIYVSRESLTGTPVSGAPGTTATLQYVGHGVWQPLNEALIATGAVGSSQLSSNLAITGTMTASNFVGSGANLTGLDYNHISNPPAIQTYTAGVGLVNSANTFSIAVGGVTSSMLAFTPVVINDSRALSLQNPANNFTGTFVGNGAGLTNLPSSGSSGFTWQVVAGTNQQAQPNTGYLCTNAAPVSITLPVTPNLCDTMRVSGIGAGGWRVAQNSNQSVVVASAVTLSVGATWTPHETNRNWYSLASSSDGQKLFAADNGDRLYTSTDAGTNWTARGLSGVWWAVASSADGTRLVATLYPGQIYTSTDSGINWTARESSRSWYSVASSADGMKLVATVYNGQIYTSTDAGTNWTARDIVRNWRYVASSADGTKLVASVNNGQIYTSIDAGTNWTARESSRNWTGVTSSADGTKLVALAYTGQIYTSIDSGVTWTAREGNRNWWGVASSSNGVRLVAAVRNGQLYTSTDSGVTWTPHESSRNWYAAASSADGSRLSATGVGEQIYTATSVASTTSTTPGPTGSVTGGQGTALELQYIGNGQFLPLSHEGTISAY